MPYRIKDTSVQVERKNGWETVKVHKNRSAALAHLRALRTNVRHQRPKKRK